MSVLLERLEKDGVVPLERYGHQVGGRQLFLKYRDCICKPLIPREHFFYETAPKSVRRYMPQYFGVISVNYVQQPSGEIQVVASLKDRQQPVSNHSLDKHLPKCTNGHSNGVSITSTKIANTDEYITPWARMCSDNLDKGLKQMSGSLQDFNKDYVILENLTSKFEAPSVLDLKVGIRWPGDTPSQQPTKMTFGVRMAGMQKFDCLHNQYTFHDKYFGKEFTESEFSDVLRSFLDNGVCFRSDLLPTVLNMLQDLQASIQRSPSFRFFSSSLLLIYDGAECPRVCRRRQQTHLGGQKAKRGMKRKHGEEEQSQNSRSGRLKESEGAIKCNGGDNDSLSVTKRPRHSLPEISLSCTGRATPISNTTPTHKATLTSTIMHTSENAQVEVGTSLTPEANKIDVTNTSDTLCNALNGVCSNRLLSVPQDLKANGVVASERIESKGEAQGLEHFPDNPPLSSKTTPLLMSASELAEHRKHVDLRMIDFARSTHADHFDQVCYEGLDEYYLTGLASLERIFQEMIDENSLNRC